MEIDEKQRIIPGPIKAILIIIGLILAVYAGITLQGNKYPAELDPVTKTFRWNFEGQPYALSVTLHESVYEYYSDQPKGLIVDKEEETLEKYLELPEEDDTVKEVTAKLNELAIQSGLSEEEKLEFAVAFVQSIPYDYEKARTDRTHPRYAYEVLYDNLGICTGKSFLMYGILDELGYGSSIFLYPNEEHMNIGVETDRQYSIDGTGYTMIETTNPKLKIGIVPSLDDSSRQAQDLQALQEFNLRNPNTTQGKSLSSPLIFASTTGKKYYGVIETFQTELEIADIQDFLAKQQPVIADKKQELDNLANRLSDLKSGGRFSKYNSLVPIYNDLIAELDEAINEYNSEVSRYNSLIGEIFL